LQDLPPPVRATSSTASGTAPAASASSSSHGLSKGALIGVIAGAAIVIILLFTGLVAWIRSRNQDAPSASSGAAPAYPAAGRYPGAESSEARASDAFMPLQHGNSSAYDMQQMASPTRATGMGGGPGEYDPYRDYPQSAGVGGGQGYYHRS